MKTVKRRLSEFFLMGVKDIADLTSYIKKRWLTFYSDFFPNNLPSLVSRNNFILPNLSAQNFNHENILPFHFDSCITLMQKEELYFETNFMHQYLYNKGYFLCLHKTVFSNNNHESNELFSPMQASVENTSGEQFRKINSIINENKETFGENLGNKHALVYQIENELFLNNSQNISHSLFRSNLYSTSLPYISPGNSVSPTTEQDIFLNEISWCSSVCSFHSKSKIAFKKWKPLNDMELRQSFCNEKYFNMPLDSQKVVYSSKKMQILTIEYLKILCKAFTINSKILKCNIKNYQWNNYTMGEINFLILGKDALKNNLVLKFSVFLYLEATFDSDGAHFTKANPIYVLFERQNELCSYIANSFNFLTFIEQIEPGFNLGIRMLFEEFDVNQIYSSKVKRLYFYKKFQIHEIFQGHLESSECKEAIKEKLVDHSPNMPDLRKICLPTMQEICKDKARYVNVNHPVHLTDKHLLTHIQDDISYENKSKSKKIFDEHCMHNNVQVNKNERTKVMTMLPNMILEHATKFETEIGKNDYQRWGKYPCKARIIKDEIYIGGNKDITDSCQYFFNNSMYSKNKAVFNTQHFPENSILSKDINASNKHENDIENQKNNSDIKISNTTKNEKYSDLKKDIKSKSIDYFNHRCKGIDFVQSNSSHGKFGLPENLSFETESLCNAPRDLSTDRENFYPKKCKRKRADSVESPNKKVQTENCQTAEINTPSIKGKFLNFKRCCVVLNKLEPSQYKALTAIDNFQDNFRNHKDTTAKPFKGNESKFNENLSLNQSLNETNNLRYNLRNSKDKNMKPSTGKKRKYQQNSSDNISVELTGTVLSTTPKDSRLYFTSEKDEPDLSTEFDTVNMESKLFRQGLASTSKRFRPRKSKSETYETENKSRKNIEKRERKQTLKNLCTSEIKSEAPSSPGAKPKRGTKSNPCLSLKAANHGEKCDKLSIKNDNPKLDSFIITSSLNTIYSNDGKSCINYNKIIQAKYQASSSQLQYDTRKKKNSESGTLPKRKFVHVSDSNINDIRSDFRLPVCEIENITKRIKSDKKVLRSQDSKSISSRNSHPTCDKVPIVPIENRLLSVPNESDDFMYFYNSGTVQIATLDDLCLKSRKKFAKPRIRSKYFTA